MRSSPSRILSVVAFLGLAVLATHTRANAPAGRYTYPATGTVLDTATKLTWQRATSDNIASAADAVAYCSGLVLAGETWRLPTAKEMLTLIDYSLPPGPLPMIDLTAFPLTPAGVFWTATPVIGSPSGAAGVQTLYSNQGDLGADFVDSPAGASLVRCVH